MGLDDLRNDIISFSSRVQFDGGGVIILEYISLVHEVYETIIQGGCTNDDMEGLKEDVILFS